MSIKEIQISGVRNLDKVHITQCGAINVLTGLNGSGKTSFLEALFILARARSFRSARLNPVIHHLSSRCVVYGELLAADNSITTMGVMRSRGDQQLFKINGNPVFAASQLAEMLPLQLINAETFSLLDGGPKVRRQFLDWGVFHVEPDFLLRWRRIQKALKHRNSLLRRGRIQQGEIAPWEAELVTCAEAVDAMRQRYVRLLRPHFLRALADLVELDNPSIEYRRGWADNTTLEQAFLKDAERDLQQGSTHSGPHRADLEIRIDGKTADDVLSRGQEKLLVCALRMAQGVLLNKLSRKTCVYLVDDLPAELDMSRRQALCRQLANINSQVFVTATDPESLRGCWAETDDVRWFHVEHGRITLQ